MQRRTFLTTLATGYLMGCQKPARVELRGFTMGTTYSVTLPDTLPSVSHSLLKTELEQALATVVNAMSTYEPHSELSQFNRTENTNWRPVSRGLFDVLHAAVDANAISHGAFDVTIGPLVDLWGFGPSLQRPTVPAADQLEKSRARVGTDWLRLDERARAVCKLRPDLQIDLSSIAKGYGVDRVARVLDAHGIRRYLIEIGGEIRVQTDATAKHNQDWTLGIEAPNVDARVRGLASTIRLGAGAIATSGNYRDYFDWGERRYPHVIDPRTGEPVKHPPLSVTVVAKSAMQADALATAILVMGPSAGYQFAQSNAIAALFITRDGKTLHTRGTAAMQPHLAG